AGDRSAQVAALGSLGEAYRLSGNSASALAYLERGKTISGELSDPVLSAAIFNSLGNTAFSSAQANYRRASEADTIGDLASARSQQADAETLNAAAIEYFQQSYDLAVSQQDVAAQMRSLLSLIPAYERADNLAAAQRHRALALSALNQFPDSQLKAFSAIKLADFLDPPAVRASYALLNDKPLLSDTEDEAITLLKQALSIGQTIENPRVVSFAYGKLGTLDERAQRYKDAIENTQAARLAADQALAKDSLYLWEWQMGRILKKQDQLSESTQAYRQAVDLLAQIRSDILNANRDLQFDFRDTVEPIYRQYAALTLRSVPDAVTLDKGEQAFEKLDTTLVTLDSLKVAELQSYFANDCVIEPVATRVDAVGDSQATAVFSTAILEADETALNKQTANSAELERLAVIVSFPDGSKKISKITVGQKEIASQINQFRLTLEEGRYQSIAEYKYEPSQQLYDWLIRPFENDLKEIETLVFVNDGLLRSVPMSALHDGQQFLIEKFAVATTPSLTLTDPERIARPTTLSALLMGVSEQSEVAPGRSFAALPAVNKELDEVAQELPNHQVLLNQDFSLSALRQTLAQKDYRILHMATHGTFGFDPSDNFVVMGAKQAGEARQFNETLTISALDELIRSVDDPTREPIELLTLTACETAIGDNRSTLGLAGVAIRAGVRSAIATLWSVNDEASSVLIAQFYDYLQDPALTKAQALQQAQKQMLQAQGHPYLWAPFTLIGNWL
ncbi:MAG: CHAT domain-containing protein, partial [Phormidesmis sp.]